jgi:hypothetical protein
MGPLTYTEPIVAYILEEWFNQSSELFVEVHIPRSGGAGFFCALTSYLQYKDLIARVSPGSVLFVLRDQQLQVRGVVDDSLISQALEQISDGEDYIIIEPCVYPNSASHLGDGNTHAELKNELEGLRGVSVWVGLELDMPDTYWEENTAEDVLIVAKS